MIQNTVFCIFLLIMAGCQPFKRPSILKKSTIQANINTGRIDRKFNHVGKLFGDVAILSSQPEKIEDFGRQKILWTATVQALHGFALDGVDPEAECIQTQWFPIPKTPNQRFKIIVHICRNPNWVKAISVCVQHQILCSGQWNNQPNRDNLAFYIKDHILTLARKRYTDVPDHAVKQNPIH